MFESELCMYVITKLNIYIYSYYDSLFAVDSAFVYCCTYYVHIYIYICVFIYIYIHMCIYIYMGMSSYESLDVFQRYDLPIPVTGKRQVVWTNG